MAATKTFEYEVRDLVGDTVKGKLAAPDQTALVRQLRSMGYIPTSVREVGKGANKDISLFGGKKKKKIKVKDLAVMCRQMSTMIGAGLPLLTTLAVLAEQTEMPVLQEALRTVSKDVEGGESLSGAMGKQPGVFPTLLVNLCHAGEMGGFLDKSLTRVAGTFESEVALRGKVKAAMAYPVVVLLICLFATIGMLLFIVPVFEKMYADLGGTLPLPTRVLVELSSRMGIILPVMIIGAIAFKVTWKRIKDKPEVRLFVDTLKLKIPVFGRLFTKVAISRFTRNLGTMLASGVPILSALDVVAVSTGNAVLTIAIRDIQTGVRQGTSIAARMANHDVFPPMVINMISVGEDTGQMESMLDKIADSYDAEIEAMTEGLTAMLEPLLIVVLASIVGTMVIALYMPMFSIFNEIE